MDLETSAPFPVDLRPDGVLVIAISGPGTGDGCVDRRFARRLDTALHDVARRADVRAAVLRALAPGCFATGSDPLLLLALETESRAKAFYEPTSRVLSRLRTMEKPIVAALDGLASGTGFELALACDARVATSQAAFLLAEAPLGCLPGHHGLLELAALMGPVKTAALAFSGARLTASDAAMLGLISDVVEPDALLDRAAELALAMVRPEKARRPPPKLRARDALTGGRGLRALQASHHERQIGHDVAHARVLDVLHTFVRSGFVAAANLEHEVFPELAIATTTRRLLQAATKRRDRSEHSTGEPLMAAVVLGRTSSATRVANKLAGVVERATATEQAKPREPPFGLIDADVDDFSGSRANLVSPLASRAAWVGVVTHTLSIAELTRSLDAAERVVGFVPYEPIVRGRDRLLELVTLSTTSPAAIEAATALAHASGFVSVSFGDGRGRYGARLLSAFIAEGQLLRAEGVDTAAIDAALCRWGFPLGPIALAEQVGARNVEVWRRAFSRIESRSAGLPRKRPASMEEMQARCALALVNEAFHCRAEGVVRDLEEADLAANLATGFPAFRGGPFQYGHELGDELRVRLVQLTRFGERFRPAPAIVCTP